MIYLGSNNCEHGHSYLEHYDCYLKLEEYEPKEKVGYLDIETMTLNFKADMGIVLSWAILGEDDNLYTGVISRRDLKDIDDSAVVNACLTRLRKYDRIVVYYGGDGRFDLPTLRTRSLYNGLSFPLYGDVKVTDAYDLVRRKLNTSRRRLQTVCDFLGIESKGHPFNFETWFRAMTGDITALRFILDHNIEDVYSLRDLYRRIKDFVPRRGNSI